MSSAVSIDLSGGFSIASPVATVFELFSPLGEKRWVPGWNPELLHPPGVDWAQGLIFKTKEQRGEVVWIVTRLDRARHEAEYFRTEPGRYAAKVRVECQPRDSTNTQVTVTYTYVGLSEAGNREISAMSKADYHDKMKRWQEWMTVALSRS